MSAFCFALMNVCVRMAGDLPSIQKSFFRNLIAFLIAAVTLWKQHAWYSGRHGNMKYLLLRSACGTIGILCNFYAVDHLVLADASMLNKMSPFFAILFSVLILNEKVKPAQALIVLGAFGGSLFVIKPTGLNMEIFPALVGFTGGVGAGARQQAASLRSRPPTPVHRPGRYLSTIILRSSSPRFWAFSCSDKFLICGAGSDTQ